jgi:hypothetical protein
MTLPNTDPHAACTTENRFEEFFRDEVYRSLKASLFNYRLRKLRIAKYVSASGRILDIGFGAAPVSPDLTRTVVADLSEEVMRHVACEFLTNDFHRVQTYKLSGTIERWLTRRSFRTYQKRGATTRLPLGLLRMANTVLFLLLILTETFISWKRTTRILVVAS